MSALRIERDGEILRITLARPETRNAFDAALIAELAEAFVDVGKARAVLLAGEGPSFCAGADVEWMRSSVDLDYEPQRRRRQRPARRCSRRSTAARRPSSLGSRAMPWAAAQGSSRAPTSRWPGRTRSSRSPRSSSGSSRRSSRRSRSRRSGRARPAATSSRASASTRRPRSASASCTRWRTTSTAPSTRSSTSSPSAGPKAARHAKRLVLERPDGPDTARRIAERRTSDEGQEGLRAFLERRPPAWRG